MNAIIDVTRVCLWCDRTISTADADHNLVVTCACGIAYSAQLLADADDAEWTAVKNRDGYSVVREHGTLTVSRP